jgi:hypothetical protein
MGETATDIIETAIRLLVGSGLVSWPAAVVLVLVIAALAVLAPRAGRAIRAAQPSPQPVSDENGPQPPGVTFPADPDPDKTEPGRGSG